MKGKFIQVLISISVLISGSLLGQTRDKGPWWPHPIWGSGDEAGGSNWVTPEKILEAVQLVKTGKVYELGHVYERDMPFIGKRGYQLVIPSFPTYPPSSPGGLLFNDELVISEIGQVGTQFDGPGHVGQQVTMADGSTTEVFYNGFTGEDIKDAYGLKKLGMENVKPYVTRGILIDIAGLKGVPSLPDRYKVTKQDVLDALNLQQIKESDIRSGDALLFNFGWYKHWPQSWVLEKAPYIDHEVTEWIIQKKPSMVGSDTTLDGPGAQVHQEITLYNGIWNLEWMRFDGMAEDKVYQFLFIFTPIRFKGATGSPGRPIAIG